MMQSLHVTNDSLLKFPARRRLGGEDPGCRRLRSFKFQGNRLYFGLGKLSAFP